MEVKTFIDESGTMSKEIDPDHKYFIVALIHADDYERLYKVFTRSRLKTLTPHQVLILKEEKEIKGTQTYEQNKQKIYEDTIRLCEDFEIGIIVIDTTKITDRLREHKARCFNYVLCLYFENYKNVSKFKEQGIQISLVIDNQNVPTKGTYTLQEYLNLELYIDYLYNEEFKVSYRDSKNDNLIQFADYVCNTVLRSLNGNEDAQKNLEILKCRMVEDQYFYYPTENRIENLINSPSNKNL